MSATKLLTDLDAINISLGYLGEQRISSLNENTKEAALARLHFSQTKRELLEMHRWSKGRKRARLTRQQERPAFGHQWAFLLPADSVRVLDVFELSEPSLDDSGTIVPDTQPRAVRSFDIEDRLILMNIPHCGISYVGDTRVSELSPLFIKGFTLTLAAKMAPALGESRLGPSLEQMAANAMQDAWMSDVRQSRSGENSDFDARSRFENPQLSAREADSF